MAKKANPVLVRSIIVGSALVQLIQRGTWFSLLVNGQQWGQKVQGKKRALETFEGLVAHLEERLGRVSTAPRLSRTAARVIAQAVAQAAERGLTDVEIKRLAAQAGLAAQARLERDQAPIAFDDILGADQFLPFRGRNWQLLLTRAARYAATTLANYRQEGAVNQGWQSE